MTQNCGQIPAAITSQTTTVFVHRTYDDGDRKRVFSLLNWSNMIGQQQREWRYLGEMPRGYCIVRLDARDSYLESAPVQILVDPPGLPDVEDSTLAVLAQRRAQRQQKLSQSPAAPVLRVDVPLFGKRWPNQAGPAART